VYRAFHTKSPERVERIWREREHSGGVFPSTKVHLLLQQTG